MKSYQFFWQDNPSSWGQDDDVLPHDENPPVVPSSEEDEKRALDVIKRFGFPTIFILPVKKGSE